MRPIFVEFLKFLAILYIKKEKTMTNEPTVLSQILCVIFCLIITGGFIFFLCLINYLLEKCNKEGKKFVMFPFF